jgi:hypothetical protein
MMCGAVWIAWHRAGYIALLPAILPVTLAILLLVICGRHALPRWRLGQASLSTAAAILIGLLGAVPISASYYATQRFASSSHDLQTRIEHWRAVWAMMEHDSTTDAFGMGLGTFPRTYFWRNAQGDMPADFRYLEQDGNRFLRLSTPHYRIGYGEVLRFLQRVDLQAHTPYRLTLDVRRNLAGPSLVIKLCERWLLYPQSCMPLALRLAPSIGTWQHYQVKVDSSVLAEAPWLLRPPVQLELAADGGPGTLDIDNLSLRSQAGGLELLRNADFSAGQDYWFFSSDRYHLPWHIKNLPLHIYIEIGWFGLLSFTLLVLSALARLARRVGRGELAAAPFLAALSGFLVVGLFDSLLDVPRLSLLFFLLLLCTVLHPIE